MIGILFIVVACILWALDTLIRYPLMFQGLSAELIVFGEHLILTLIFLPILYKKREKFFNLKMSQLFNFFIIGGMGSAIGTLTFTKAFGLINPSLVILLQKLQPVIAISLSAIILKETMKKEFFLWALLALVGGILISYQDLLPGILEVSDKGLDFSGNSLKGYLLTMIAVVSWGGATVFGKKLSRTGFGETEIMSGRFTMGLICLLPLLLSFNISINVSLANWTKIFAMAIMSGVVAMYFYYRGLKSIPAHIATLAEMFFPFMAIGVNWIFLGKDLTLMQILGAIFLLISSSVIQSKHY